MILAMVIVAVWIIALTPVLCLGVIAALADRDAARFSDRDRST